MATWKDGPRYAPATRPIAFAEPATAISLAPAPLPGGPPLGVVASAAPPPNDYTPASGARPLSTIEPIPATRRDPGTPFQTIATALTASDATALQKLGAAKNPQAPFQVASSLPALRPTWAPPPKDAKPEPVRQTVSWRDTLTAAYPPLIITLVVAGVVASVQSLLAVLILIIASFSLIPRTRFRAEQLRKITYSVIGALAGVWIVAQVVNTTMYNVNIGLSWWVFFGCWGVAVADIWLQWLGLRRGDAPNQTA